MDEVRLTPDDVRRARRACYGNISYVDGWTGRLPSTPRVLGVAENALVVLLADHGDMLGERGLWYKMSFFEDSARIPVIVHHPGTVRSRADGPPYDASRVESRRTPYR